MKYYTLRIQQKLQFMTDISSRILPPNQSLLKSGAQWCLHVKRSLAGARFQPFKDIAWDEELFGKFKPHVLAVEKKMSKALSLMKWFIDSSSTVALLVGSGQLESVRVFSRLKSVLANQYLLEFTYSHVPHLRTTRGSHASRMHGSTWRTRIDRSPIVGQYDMPGDVHATRRCERYILLLLRICYNKTNSFLALCAAQNKSISETLVKFASGLVCLS